MRTKIIQSLEIAIIDLIRFKEYLDMIDFTDVDIERILEGLKNAKLTEEKGVFV